MFRSLVRRLAPLLVSAVLGYAGPVRAAAPGIPQPWGNWPRWGDQGDGTYRNPVLPADYSDLDCIRVGTEYFAISSTFQFSPGVVILQSRDLVNWRIVGHVVGDLTQIGPELNWNRMDAYGKGIWAGAIRYHAGKFWVYFGTPEEGFFVATAPKVSGPWTAPHCLMHARGWDDGCPFWDDDGQGYFVCTRFAPDPVTGTTYNVHLFRLTPDGRDLVPHSDAIVHQSQGAEANKLYKVNGWYYFVFSEVHPGEGRVVMVGRAQSLYGMWHVRQIGYGQRAAHEPNQGGLVQTPDGQWYFLTHHGTGGAWEGRAASLVPVAWFNGWPSIGTPDSDGIGTMPWAGRKPVAGFPATVPQTSDDFGAPELAPQWEWNYQPRPGKWSLTARPGWLRLQAFPALAGDNLLKVPDVLTQRSIRAAGTVATARLDLAGMADGEHAGLVHFSAAGRKDAPAANTGSIGVVQVGTKRYLELSHDGTFTRGPALAAASVWLRSSWGLEGRSQFAYSTDGVHFTDLGEPYALAWGSYRGDRIGLFTYNNRAEAGYLDVDSFTYTFAPHAGPLAK